MDLFNKKKIEQLERDVDFWKIEFEKQSKETDAEIKRLKAIIRGEHVCGGYCKKCKNGIPKKDLFSMYVSYTCALDCKCKDFQKAE